MSLVVLAALAVSGDPGWVAPVSDKPMDVLAIVALVCGVAGLIAGVLCIASGNPGEPIGAVCLLAGAVLLFFGISGLLAADSRGLQDFRSWVASTYGADISAGDARLLLDGQQRTLRLDDGSFVTVRAVVADAQTFLLSDASASELPRVTHTS